MKKLACILVAVLLMSREIWKNIVIREIREINVTQSLCFITKYIFKNG